MRVLQQRRNAKKKLQDLNEKLLSQYRDNAKTRGLSVKRKVTESGLLSSNDEGDYYSTLTEQNINQTESIATTDGSEPLDFEPPLTSTPQKSKKPRASENISGKSSYVSVKVHWKSKESSKILPDDLESLGKMLCRGTYTQIACAAWRCQRVREQIVILFLKDVD